jgi:hypothetical protein
MELKKYTTYRRQVLTAKRAEIAANTNGGINAGSLMAFDRKAAVASGVLDELDALADWLDAQEPDYVEPMTDETRARWAWALDNGFDVPADVVKQLEA